jgi:hypothetical protein
VTPIPFRIRSVQSAQEHPEEIMHPIIIQQLAADHIREIHAEAENDRLGRRARRARRRAPSLRPRLPASGTLNDDDPRLNAGQRPARYEQPTAPPLPVMAGSPPEAGDASTRRDALDHSH